MKKIILIGAAMVALTSCRKSNEPAAPPQPGISKKLVRLNYPDYPSSDTWFTYDNQGRMISAQDSVANSSVDLNVNPISYTNFLKSENRNYAEGKFTLDAEGRAIQLDLTTHQTANTSSSKKYTYTYNADGYLVDIFTQYSGGGTGEMVMEYAGGNMVSIKYLTNGQENSTWKYSYSAQEDKTGLNFNFTIYTNSLAGKKNKNLAIKAEQYSPANVKVFETDIDNELDSDGYIIKKTYHNLTNNTVDHYAYVYDK